jgi:hypothetical protein
MTQKLFLKARWLRDGVTRLESEHNVTWQLRSILLNGAFLPDSEHGSGIGDCMNGGGHCPEKAALTAQGLSPR